MGRKDIHKDGKKTQFTSENQPENKGIKKGQKHYSTILRKIADKPAFKFVVDELKKHGVNGKHTNIEGKAIMDLYWAIVKGNAKISNDISEQYSGQKLASSINVTGDFEFTHELNEKHYRTAARIYKRIFGKSPPV